MPEMTFTVQWPDGSLQNCYSPSLVMHDHLEAGNTYTVADFSGRSVLALQIASDRVQDKFGYACTSAAATSEQIQAAASAYAPDAQVTVTRMHPPLPRSFS